MYSPRRHSPLKIRKFKNYDERNVRLAVQAHSLGMPIRKAATLYGVPKSTVSDRITGHVLHGTKSGPVKYLSEQEEKELVKFLIGCSKIGFAKSRKQVLMLTQSILAHKRGVTMEEVNISYGWWGSFNKRHPQLTLRTATPLAYVRSVAQDPEIFETYFDLLEETLLQNDLLTSPHRIFNCDESGFSLEHRPGKQITLRGTKQFSSVTSGDKSNITILACCSAAGYIMPPMVIFDRKCLKPDLTRGEVPGTIYGLSANGWIDSELFEEWFDGHFLACIPPQRPVLLLLDGHSSHYHPPTIRKAASNGVILFCLPPHTTHLAQPLDKCCFSPLKKAWNEECLMFMSTHPRQVVNRYNFMEIFSRAWARGMTPSNAISGFQATGVFPLNRRAITIPGLEEDEDVSMDDCALQAGVSYVPLFSPAPKKDSSRKSVQFSDEEIIEFEIENQSGQELSSHSVHSDDDFIFVMYH